MGAAKNEVFFATAILRNTIGFKKSKLKKTRVLLYQLFSVKIFCGKYL